NVQAVGRVAQDYRQYLIVTDQEAHGPEDIGNVVIANGLRVRDVASVRVGTEDHVRIVAGDGRPAALINVARQVEGNTLEVADSVAGIVAALAPTLPPGVHLKRVYDQAALVRDAVRSVRDAILIGAVLAVLVLLLFLRHGRITAISAAAIPVTLAVTVFVMWLIGQTFNLMTLGAMAIAIGLVIDDAVVVTENIARHLRLGPAGGPPAAPRAALQHPRRIAVAAVALVALGVGLWQIVGTGFLPEIDEGAFILDYWTPGGTALAETNRQLSVAESLLAATPEVTGTARRTGAELGMFATAQNRGDIVVRLAPRNRRARDVFAVIDDVRDRIQGAVPRLHIEFMQILADVINDLAASARSSPRSRGSPSIAKTSSR